MRFGWRLALCVAALGPVATARATTPAYVNDPAFSPVYVEGPCARGHQPAETLDAFTALPDGSFLVAACGPVLLRFTAAGHPDRGFVYGGRAAGTPRLLAVEPRGEILVLTAGTGGRLALLGLTRSGRLDPHFGRHGSVSIDGATPVGLGLAPDGRVVLATAGRPGGLAVTTLRADGSGARRVVVDPGASAAPRADGAGLAVEPDGSVLVSAVRAGRFELAHLTASGALDRAFGSGGIASPAVAGAVEVASGGRPLLLGSDPLGPSVRSERLTPAGAPDATYGTAGIAESGAAGVFGSYGTTGFFAAAADQGLLELSLFAADGSPVPDAPTVVPPVSPNLALQVVAPLNGGSGLLVGGTFGVEDPADPDNPPRLRVPATGVARVVEIRRFALAGSR